jgi:hypothetical protein
LLGLRFGFGFVLGLGVGVGVRVGFESGGCGRDTRWYVFPAESQRVRIRVRVRGEACLLNEVDSSGRLGR